ncbi:MAG: radical SAM protein [archaeon]|nr:radical SAM protein [archaeon]
MHPYTYPATKERVCRICKKPSQFLSRAINICRSCIHESPHEAVKISLRNHGDARKAFGLPGRIPESPSGMPCNLCANECRMGVGQSSYCGLRKNVAGRLISRATSDKGLYDAYLDPHVTNCCAAWFCPAGTGSGYPTFSACDGPERGYYNLAIFFYGCNFDCLFCQNSSHKYFDSAPSHSIDDLVERTLSNPKITCWCFFGGSPEPQLPFALKASERVLELVPKGRILRICFEWNGCGHPDLVRKAAEIAFKSGGNIKFDLKCFDENMSFALSGISNRRAFQNFEMIAREFHALRGDPSVLTATTLMVPGYVDSDEVEGIAKFIASLDQRIPYSLLVFHPDFLMKDLPITPLEQALSCYKAAKKHLERVNIGNLHLLGRGMKDFIS